LIRIRAARGALPLGAILAACGGLLALAVGLLHLDRLPVSLCVFKAVTGWPCLTCGTTRALGRLLAGDLTGALALNPLVVVAALFVSLWGLLDALLLPRGRALAVELGPRLHPIARLAALALAAGNWLYLVAAGR
jgi:hypothetical protein